MTNKAGFAIAELALPDSSKLTSFSGLSSSFGVLTSSFGALTSSFGAFTYRLESCHLKSFTYKVKSI